MEIGKCVKMHKNRIPKTSRGIVEQERKNTWSKFEGHFLTAPNQKSKYLLRGQVQSQSDLHVK